ncbi:MAG: alpha/beta fold hydrolase, partial [Vulcanimicrobiaceae bacterium]
GAEQLVFCHGWISSRRMFADLIGRLDTAQFTAHLMDFRGCGLSDRVDSGHDLAGYASDLRAVLASISGEITIVAHSMGARVAMVVAAEQPQGLRRLILLAPGSPLSVRVDPRHHAMMAQAYGMRSRLVSFIAGSMSARVEPDVLERLVDDALVAQREHWFGWYDQGRREDIVHLLPSIAVPTLILAGSRDPLVSASMLKRTLAPAIGGASLIQLKNVGHNLPVEAPGDVCEAIARFSRSGIPNSSPL